MTEIQIDPLSDTTHFQFVSYTFHSSFVSKAGICAFDQQSASACRAQNIDFSNQEFQPT